ncbi:hypothetical protein HDU78_011128, partial [Chytriomyces hyalinus]
FQEATPPVSNQCRQPPISPKLPRYQWTRGQQRKASLPHVRQENSPLRKAKPLLKELKELKEAAEHDLEGIIKGSARQLRSAKTPLSESGDNHNEGNNHEERDDHKESEDDEEGHDDKEGDDFEEGHDHDEEADNAETELATSDVEEEHLGAPLTGRPLKPSGMYTDPEKTAFDVFCQYLEVSQSHMVNTEEGLAVAF